MGLNNDWMQRDISVLWHPCTQMKDHEHMPVIPIQRGEGIWLHDFEGNRYMDAVSSWWVNVFGHANPYINQRIKDQLDQLEHPLHVARIIAQHQSLGAVNRLNRVGRLGVRIQHVSHFRRQGIFQLHGLDDIDLALG